MQSSRTRSAAHARPLDDRSAFSAPRLLQLALAARRRAAQTMLASMLLVRFGMVDAVAQEFNPPSDRLPGPLELWGTDGQLTEFPKNGEYNFPEGSSAFVPGFGWFTDDVQIPHPDGSPAYDLKFVPYDEIPMSSADDFGGDGYDTLLGGAGDDVMFGDSSFGAAEGVGGSSESGMEWSFEPIDEYIFGESTDVPGTSVATDPWTVTPPSDAPSTDFWDSLPHLLDGLNTPGFEPPVFDPLCPSADIGTGC